MFKELNPLLHSELRLAVMSILIGVESADFVFIRQQTGATAGNLSVQLDKLAKANYIEIEKTFRGKMPCTVCRITDTGRDAFAEYVAALQTISGNKTPAGYKKPAGIFIAANNYSVQKNVTRNGTLKSSVQPWKIETTA